MIAKRAQEITPFLVMDVLERAHTMEREGVHVIHLEVGEPDFDTPHVSKRRSARLCKRDTPITRTAWAFWNFGRRFADTIWRHTTSPFLLTRL